MSIDEDHFRGKSRNENEKETMDEGDIISSLNFNETLGWFKEKGVSISKKVWSKGMSILVIPDDELRNIFMRLAERNPRVKIPSAIILRGITTLRGLSKDRIHLDSRRLYTLVAIDRESGVPTVIKSEKEIGTKDKFEVASDYVFPLSRSEFKTVIALLGIQLEK